MDDDEIDLYWLQRENEGRGLRAHSDRPLDRLREVEVISFRCGCGQQLQGDVDTCPRCGTCYTCG